MKPIALVLALVVAACATTGTTDEREIAGAVLDFTIAGANAHRAGAPTLVFESGLGDGKGSWNALTAQLARQYRTFAYSRPGYGQAVFSTRYRSDRDGRRTGDEIAQGLRQLLDEAGVEPPYILVGHSIGGLYMMNFARLFPGDVAGLVLVDGRPPRFTETCLRLDLGMCEPPSLMVAMMPEHQRLEVRGLADTIRAATDLRGLEGLPTLLLVAGRPDLVSSARFQSHWIAEQRELSNHLPGSRLVIFDRASHYLHHQRTDEVAREIAAFAARIDRR